MRWWVRALLSPLSLHDGSSLSARCADAAAVKSSVGMLRGPPSPAGDPHGKHEDVPSRAADNDA